MPNPPKTQTTPYKEKPCRGWAISTDGVGILPFTVRRTRTEAIKDEIDRRGMSESWKELRAYHRCIRVKIEEV
jgi:hypothetical protein